MKFTTIFVFLIPVVVARHHHRTLLETILNSRANFYTKVNEDVQNVINSIFSLLNLPDTFLLKSRIKLLLTMHYDLNSIAEKNYDIYQEMKNVTNNDMTNKTANNFKYFDLIQEILNDKAFNLSGSVEERKHLHKNKTKKNVNKSEFRDSKEFMEFIQDFIKKVDNLSVKDFFKKPQKLPEVEKGDDNSEMNLKIWRPPAVIELDYINDTLSRRIFRGHKTRVKEFPFVASIHLLGVFACAGSIISRDLIITAASCVQILYNNRLFRENPRTLHVRVGSDFYSKNGEPIDVIEVYFHPGYDPQTLKNNLAILRLQKLIVFRRDQKRIKRILFDRNPAHLPDNTNGILVLGWGSRTDVVPFHRRMSKQMRTIQGNDSLEDTVFNTDSESECNFHEVGQADMVDYQISSLATWSMSPQTESYNMTKIPTGTVDTFQRLTVANLEIYSIQECAEIYSKRYVTNKHFCAGFISVAAGACNKDVGGPGIVGGKLIGVVSFGPPVCGTIDAPTVFTKLGYYSKWIDSIMALQPPVLGVRTTVRPSIPRRPYYSKKPKSRTATPVFTKGFRAQLQSTPGDIVALRALLKELSQSNNTLLHDILYADNIEDDFFDMFKPTEQVDPSQQLVTQPNLSSLRDYLYGYADQNLPDIFKSREIESPLQHPLVNKSLFAIPDIHTFATTSSIKYMTIMLTTSSPRIPPTTTAEPTGGVSSTSRTPAINTATTHIIDILRTASSNPNYEERNEYAYDNYDLMSTKSRFHLSLLDNNPQYYVSYEETTPRHIGRTKMMHRGHNHRRHRIRHHTRRPVKVKEYSDDSYNSEECESHGVPNVDYENEHGYNTDRQQQ